MSVTTPSHVSSRPTTPLRRRSQPKTHDTEALNTLNGVLTEPLIELNDGLAMLDQNLQHLQMMHESITSFNESFSAFLYGIEMNAWCVEFSEAPTYESFRRERGSISRQVQQQLQQSLQHPQQPQQEPQPQQQQQQQQQQHIDDTTDQMEVDKVEEYSEQRVLEDSNLPSGSTEPLMAVPKSRLTQLSNSARIPASSGSKIPINSSSSAKSKSHTAQQKLPTTPWR